MPTRRTFIQTVAAMAAVPPPEPLLPTVKFGKTEITRMIIGSNPFYGYSHFNRILDAAMREYYTPERRVEVLLACERQGINSWQLHYNDQPREDLKRYRAAGGKMNLILLADFDLMKDPKLANDTSYLQKHPGLQDFLSKNASVKAELQNDPVNFMNREKGYEKWMAGRAQAKAK